MTEEVKPPVEGGEDGDAWFEKGYEHVLPPDMSKSGRTLRYWMPPGTSKKLVFLTGEPVVYFEHAVYYDGNWRNYFTCVATMGKECPLCVAARKKKDAIQRYQACAYSVIDTSEFTDRSGAKRSNTKKLYIAKTNTAEKLKKRHEKEKAKNPLGLRGLLIEVTRGMSKKSPGVGEDFEVEDRLDLAAVKDSQECNYREELKPDIEAMKRMCVKLGVLEGVKEGSTSPKVEYE